MGNNNSKIFFQPESWIRAPSPYFVERVLPR